MERKKALEMMAGISVLALLIWLIVYFMKRED